MKQNKVAETGEGNAPRETFRDSHVRLLEKQVIEYALQCNELIAQRDELLNEVSNLKHDYAIVSAQRNELLTVLKALTDFEAGYITRPTQAQIAAAKAAIAKVEGGGQ